LQEAAASLMTEEKNHAYNMFGGMLHKVSSDVRENWTWPKLLV